MNGLQYAIGPWLALTVLCGGLALIAVWSRRPTYLRPISVGAFLLVAPVTLAVLLYVLGWPTPFNGFLKSKAEFSVLGAKMIPGDGIYAYLDKGGIPRSHRFAWNREFAEKLQQLMEDEREGKSGTPKLIIPPFEFSWEMRKPPELYALPQPKVLPEKQPPKKPKRQYGV